MTTLSGEKASKPTLTLGVGRDTMCALGSARTDCRGSGGRARAHVRRDTQPRAFMGVERRPTVGLWGTNHTGSSDLC